MNFKKNFFLNGLLGYVLIALGGIAPILLALLAGAIGEANGCTVNEADIHPCIIGGMNFGGLIGGMFVFGWLTLMTFPAALIGLIIWTIKIFGEFRIRKYGVRYSLTELKSIKIHQVGDNLYAETLINVSGRNQSVNIFFKTKTEAQNFKQGSGSGVEGILQANGAVWLLKKTRMI